jgi:hypothetical protein
MPATRGADPEHPAAEALAEAAGLRRAWAEHRAEVVEAVAGLAALRAAFSRPADWAVEPMPPYAVPPAARRREDGR